ncbi:MAG: hypothetical protein AB1511_13835 [Deinococcota bacterium]
MLSAVLFLPLKRRAIIRHTPVAQGVLHEYLLFLALIVADPAALATAPSASHAQVQDTNTTGTTTGTDIQNDAVSRPAGSNSIPGDEPAPVHRSFPWGLIGLLGLWSNGPQQAPVPVVQPSHLGDTGTPDHL